ncbi:PucR family transcriptional regulator [Rhodococcoides yunnanense]|uniref:PucR family transcriptional regulator n=1 Tax=Rhodococcoides yunnanense TaxID=278209 RepID=UPI0009337526|nr:PucR family transcriptional regulator [Rhodococcus yunnanensis]
MTSPIIAGAGVRSLVDELGEFLGRSVVIDDPAVRLICASRHFGDEDTVRIRAMLDRDAGDEIGRFVLGQGAARWHGPHVLEGSDALGLKSRLCVPLYGPGMLIGLLMVIDADQSLTSAEIEHIAKVSRDIAAQMYTDSLESDPQQVERRSALRDLLTRDAQARQGALAYFEESRDLPALDSIAVTVVAADPAEDSQTPVDIALRVAIDTVTRIHSKSTRVYIAEDSAVLLQVKARPIERSELARQAGQIESELRRLLGDASSSTCIGIGTTTGGLANAFVARHRADIALKAARRVSSITDTVVFWHELGVDAVLLDLPDTSLVWTTVPQPLRDLIDADDSGKLVKTLRAFLDNGGSIARTATTLHMHRTSLYYRLEQIRVASGIDLDSGNDRLLMHMGLHLLDIVERPV